MTFSDQDFYITFPGPFISSPRFLSVFEAIFNPFQNITEAATGGVL